VGKERGALRAFSLGRTVPASQKASAEDRDGPLAMQVLFLVLIGVEHDRTDRDIINHAISRDVKSGFSK